MVVPPLTLRLFSVCRAVVCSSLSNTHVSTIGVDKAGLVALANQWSSFIGLKRIPSVEAQVAGKMGLRGVEGLNIAPNEKRAQSGRAQGRTQQRTR